MLNSGNGISLCRPKNQVLPTRLPDIEIKSTSGRRVGRTLFLSLHSAIPYPDLGNIDKLLKHLFFIIAHAFC